MSFQYVSDLLYYIMYLFKEPTRFFTDFDQIDYQSLPQYVGGSLQLSGFFIQFYNWAQFMCHGGIKTM